jgi:hypothetical protein
MWNLRKENIDGYHKINRTRTIEEQNSRP